MSLRDLPLGKVKQSIFLDCHESLRDSRNDESLDCHDLTSSSLAMTGKDSSLRGRIVDSHEAIQANQIDCYESANADSCNDGLFDSINHTTHRHCECGSTKHSIFVDCHENSLRSFSRNDESVHDSPLQNLTLYHNAKSTPNPPKIDYIIFLDSDDFWEVDLLEKCVVDIENAEVLLFDIDIFYDGLPPPITLIA